MKEFSKDALLGGVDRSKRKAIESLFADVDVHYVVVLESPDTKRRNLLTVGPKLDYTSLEAVEGIELDGLQPVGFVDAMRHAAAKTSIFRSRASEQIEQLESIVVELRNENKQLHREVSQALKTVELVAQERILLKNKGERLNHQHEEQTSLQTQIDQREAELLKMEEDLMDRMNQLVQKEAELEQWEENMFARERQLATSLEQKGEDASPSSTLRATP